VDPVLSDSRITTYGLFREASSALSDALGRASDEWGGMPPSFDILLRLARSEGQRLRMTDLAAQCGLSPSGLSRAVDRLSADGLVRRASCPDDARGAFAELTRQGDRPRVRMAGLVVSALGCAVAVVGAWALPVWMTLFGAGFALVGIAAGSARRRLLATLAAAHLIALAVFIAGIEGEVGRRDEWGDYPTAGGIALVVLAAITVAAIVTLTRNAARFGYLPSPSPTNA